MEVGKLTVQYRNNFGKGSARKLRAQGLVPGICYGKIGSPLPVSISPKALKASLDPLKKHNTLISLDIEGTAEGTQHIKVMLKDYQIDPIRRNILHVDLLAIDEHQIVEVEVPLELTGKAKGLIQGGQLHMVRHSFHVKCKPEDIPGKILVDVTEMDIGSVLHISDVVLPGGVQVVDSEKLTIVTCTAAAGEEEEKTEESADEAATAATSEPEKK